MVASVDLHGFCFYHCTHQRCSKQTYLSIFEIVEDVHGKYLALLWSTPTWRFLLLLQQRYIRVLGFLPSEIALMGPGQVAFTCQRRRMPRSPGRGIHLSNGRCIYSLSFENPENSIECSFRWLPDIETPKTRLQRKPQDRKNQRTGATTKNL